MVRPEDNPLVTLLIVCYNQEHTIAEALQSAFDQTYSPIEILVQDDHSTDNTVNVIKTCVQVYQKNGGRHEVVVRANQSNLGIVRNYEDAAFASRGELIVTAAGDDVSMPDRVEKIVKAWLDSGRQASLITHSGVTIDADGKTIGKIGQHSAQFPLGACMSYRRDVFDGFERVDPNMRTYEDTVFPLRALLVGTELYIPDKLLRYRLGFGQTNSSRHGIDFQLRITMNGMLSCAQLLRDLECRKRFLSDAEYADWMAKFVQRKEFWSSWHALLSGKRFAERWRGFVGVSKWRRSISLLHVLFLFPRRFSGPCYEMFVSWKRADCFDR